MVSIDPFQSAVVQLLTAVEELHQFWATISNKPGADVVAELVNCCLVPGHRCQPYDVPGDLFFALVGNAGDFFNRATAAVTGGEIHIWIHSGRVAAQGLLYPAEFLKYLPPVEQRQQAQAVESIAAGELFPCLAVLLTQIEVEQRAFLLALQPVLDRRQSGFFVVEKSYQLRGKILRW